MAANMNILEIPSLPDRSREEGQPNPSIRYSCSSCRHESWLMRAHRTRHRTPPGVKPSDSRRRPYGLSPHTCRLSARRLPGSPAGSGSLTG